VEEERSYGHAGLRVSLQVMKGIFDYYATISIKAEKSPAEGSWQWLTALPVRPDTSEYHGNGRLPACHCAGMA
jgi:hypothetical protein